MGASIYPLREIMLICLGCGGERLVPEHEFVDIRSADDLKRFTSTRLGQYACHCGATHCDLRILPSAEAVEEMQAERAASSSAKEEG